MKIIFAKIIFSLIYSILLFAIVKVDLNRIKAWKKIVLIILGIPSLLLEAFILIAIFNDSVVAKQIFVFGCGIYCVFIILTIFHYIIVKGTENTNTKLHSLAKRTFIILKVLLCSMLLLLFISVIYFIE